MSAVENCLLVGSGKWFVKKKQWKLNILFYAGSYCNTKKISGKKYNVKKTSVKNVIQCDIMLPIP